MAGQAQEADITTEVVKEALDAVVIRLDYVARELIAGHREPQDVSPSEVRHARLTLRSTHGPSFLAELVVSDWIRWIYETAEVPPGSLNFVVRDIETPEEAGFLRSAFNGSFQLIGIDRSHTSQLNLSTVLDSLDSGINSDDSEERYRHILAMADVIVPYGSDRTRILASLQNLLKE